VFAGDGFSLLSHENIYRIAHDYKLVGRQILTDSLNSYVARIHGVIMSSTIRIGLIGDYNPAVVAHQAIPRALALAGEALTRSVEAEWVPTEDIQDSSRVVDFDGLWCVPASPYKSMEGALCAIQFAREQGRPFLGTCGGFQHAIVEYARSVLGWADAEHAETAPGASRAVIAPLACTLVEVTDTIRLREPSRIAAAYQCVEISEGYHCSYGLNPWFQAELLAGRFRIVAEDVAGAVRAVELDNHPFFVATLFQPERAALQDRVPPIVAAFVRAAAAHKVASA
jgi:CTP synthase (UTP-ammonia lyase)